MKRIAFLCDLEEGHIIPTFPLAHELQKRGHEIWYLSVVENQDIIEEQGFRFYCLFGDLYPKGTKEKVKRRSLLSEDEQLRESLLVQEYYVECLIKEDEYGAFIREVKADIALISSYLPFEIMILYYKYGLRPVLLGPVIREPDQKLSDSLEGIVNMFEEKVKSLFLNYLNSLNIPFDSLRRLTDPMDSLHEIIFCPGEFDFDNPLVRSNLHYVGPSIRTANPLFDVYKKYNIPTGKKIIYSSMGSQGIRHGNNCDLFFRKIINVMKEIGNNELHLIVCVGKEYDQSKLGIIPDNVTLLGWGPQVDILRQASVAVIHGGLGGIKECIYYGVPMIVFPQGYDQPQNARRIIYHGLGLTGDIETISEYDLKQHLLNALHNINIRANIFRMQKIFREREEQQLAANLIENILGIESPVHI